MNYPDRFCDDSPGFFLTREESLASCPPFIAILTDMLGVSDSSIEDQDAAMRVYFAEYQPSEGMRLDLKKKGREYVLLTRASA